jgi:hypothetical protein
MTPPFLIFGLPRSRTFWLSIFLTYGSWVCSHEESRHVRSVDDIRSWLSQDRVGTVETAAAPFWRLIRNIRPDIRVVVIRRPAVDVLESLVATGVEVDRPAMLAKLIRAQAKLDQVAARMPGALVVPFADLVTESVCAAIFEYCLPYRHDHGWWERTSALNLQINLPAMLRYGAAHGPQLRKAESLCAQEIRRLMWRETSAQDLDGMTFQEERFETFWRDGQTLFAEHCADIGEAPDNFLHKNLSLARQLDAMGRSQIVTARCNGRMFGYLASVIGPSLEDAGVSVATQTTFYSSRHVRGLGMRLQRASLAALEARGGRWEIVQRAGVRGDGARLGAIYRRMGAEDAGHLYRLRAA